MKKRILCAILAVLMVVPMFTACGGNGGSEVDIDLSAIKGLEGYMASAEPLTLTAHIPEFDAEKWDVYHEAARLTNIMLEGTVGKDQDSAQAFNLMLLEEKLPDIIYGSRSNLDNAGMVEGALVDLKPYVTNPDIMPNLAKIYEEHPEYLAMVTAPDGGVYVNPKIREAGPTQAWYTREDWMEKLGLEHPKTYEEFVAVMDAFRNQDPNGNGKKDEVPYHGEIKHLFYFFGLNGSRYWDVNEETGRFYMPYITENYKNALKTIAEWYQLGYIDQECFTRKNSRSELWGSNTGGMTFNWFSSTMSYNTQIKNIPGFHVSVMMPPANIYGKAYCHSPGNIIDTSGWGISVDNEHIAETLKYMDFWYSDDGSLLNAMGIKDRDYKIDANGNAKYTELATNYEGGAPQYVRDIGCIGIGYYMRQKWLLSGMTDEAAAGNKAYIEADFTCDLVPPVSFTEEEQKVINEKWTSCQTYIDEYYQQVILGNKDVDSTWDAYVKQVEKLGLADAADAYNAAYDRYLERMGE